MTTAQGLRHRLTGKLTVALPPEQAFRLFTPRGEQDWAHGWTPCFPADADDDTAPGTVFVTHANARTTTWIVVDRTWGRQIRYARTVPEGTAGTVAVDLEEANGHSEVTVTYDLTAVTEAARADLAEFAAGYVQYLQSWQDDIAVALRS